MSRFITLALLIVATFVANAKVTLDVYVSWVNGKQQMPSTSDIRVYISDQESQYTDQFIPGPVEKLYARVDTGMEVTKWSWGANAISTDEPSYSNEIKVTTPSRTLSWQADWKDEGEGKNKTIYLGVHLNWLKYTINFDPNGATGTVIPLNGVYNTQTVLPTSGLTKTGYDFLGWSRKADATAPDKDLIGTKDFGKIFGFTWNNKTTTLYAVWKAKTATLTFDPQEGSVSPTSISVTYDQALGDLPEPTRTGYTFKGWYTASTGGSQITEETISKYTSTATVYARWEINNYKITVQKSGEGSGTVSPSGTSSYAYGSELTLTATASAGSKFVQWSDGVATAERTITVGASNITYTAQFDLKTFTVTFDPGEGAVSSTSKIVTYSKPYGELPKPVWEGHTFSEWQTRGGSRVTADDTVRLEDDIILTAKYTDNTYLIQVIRNTASEGSGSVSGGGRYDYGTTVTIQAHANDGSKFTQWSDGDKNASREITVTKDVTYSASFDLEQYEVKFIYYNAQGQQIVDTQAIKYGKAATPPDNGVVDQYPKHHFTGWGNNSYGTVRGNLEVQALYEWDSYAISYNANAPSGEYRGSMSVQTLKMDAPHPLSRNNFSRTGHTFLGWSQDKSATAPTYHDEESLSALTDVRDATVDLYAVWQPNTYTITFNPNGEDASVSPETKPVTYGQLYGDLPTPERPANSFRGWYSTRSGEDKIEPTTKVTITANQTLYAQWTSLRKTITYNLDGGRNPDGAPASYIEGEGATLPIPTRTGYVFKGWYTDAALTSEVQTAIDKDAKGEKTFYARWRVKYTALTLNANGGELAKADSVRILEYGKKYQDVPNIYPTHRDDFAELYRISVNNGVFSTDDLGRGDSVYYTVKALDFLPPNATFTYRATVRSAGTGSYSNWEDGDGQLGGEADGTGAFDVLANESQTIYSKANVQTQEVALDGSLTAGRNGLSGFSFSVELSCGTNGVGLAALPTPTCEGLAFVGWYTALESGTRIYDTSTVGADPETTLYAHWAEKTYTVTFDSMGGSSCSSQTVTYNGTYAGKLPTPMFAGYTFAGWYTAAEGGTAVTESTKVTISTDQTLYAHWTANTYTVQFDKGGESATGSMSPVTLRYGESYTLPTNKFTNGGRSFGGWRGSDYRQYAEEQVVSNLTATANGTFTFSALWENDFIVRFNKNGGSGEMDDEKIYVSEDTAISSNKFTRVGYTFKGWATTEKEADEGKVRYLDGATITRRTYDAGTIVELFATWTINSYTVRFFSNGGNGDVREMQAKYDEDVTAPSFTRNGFDLVGWTSDPSTDSFVAIPIKNLTTVPNDCVNLYARWRRKRIESRLSIAADCAEDGPNTMALELLPGGDGKCEDIEFAKDAGGNGQCVRLSFINQTDPNALQTGELMTSVMGSGELSFSYQVYFAHDVDDCYFNVTRSSKGSEEDKIVDDLHVTDIGTWRDISCDITVSGDDIASVITWQLYGYAVDADYVLIDNIKWRPKNGYVTGSVGITYRLNDGTVAPKDIITNVTCKVGAAIGALPVAKSAGREFLGWATDAKASAVDVGESWLVPGADTQLYAVWKASENPVPTEGDRPVIGEGFKFTTDARFDYVIWKKNDLTEADWTKFDTVTGNGQPVALPMFVDQQGFFKVEVIQRGSK